MAMYWANNSSNSTTTTGNPISFEGGTTILVSSNWPWFDIEPFPSLFDGDFWRWIYHIGDILTLETEHVCPECGQEFALEATIELEIDTFMLVEDDEE